MQKFLDEAIDQHVFPGCVCLIMNKNEKQYYIAGKKMYDKETSLSYDSLFDLASLTKVFSTTMMVLRLIQNGQLSYETKVSQILKSFNNVHVTIKHLLTHSSGLPADLPWKNGEGKSRILNDIYDLVNEDLQLGKVCYSDLGYILLGEIIETISGHSLDEVFEKEVKEPLNLPYATYHPEKEQCVPTEICPYTHILLQGVCHDRKGRGFNGLAGHAGVFATIYDLEIFVSMILNNDGTYLEKKYIDDLFTTYASTEGMNRGIGFITYNERSIFSTYNSKQSICHTGFTGTSILVDREKQFACVLLSNRIYPSRENTKIISWRKLLHEEAMKKYS